GSEVAVTGPELWPLCRRQNGPAPRSLAPEAYDCFMARSPRRLHRMQGCGAIVAPTAGLPSVRPRHPAIKSCRALTTPTAVDKWPAAARLLAVALAGPPPPHLSTCYRKGSHLEQSPLTENSPCKAQDEVRGQSTPGV